MKLLLEKGVAVDAASSSGTPLIWAAGHGRLEAVKLLLERHADVTYSFLKLLPIHSLLRLQLTLNLGLNNLGLNIEQANSSTEDGATPLLTAVAAQQPEIVELLIKVNANAVRVTSSRRFAG